MWKNVNHHKTKVDAQSNYLQHKRNDLTHCEQSAKKWWSPSMQWNSPPSLYLQLQVLSESTGEITSYWMFLTCVLFQHFIIYY